MTQFDFLDEKNPSKKFTPRFRLHPDERELIEKCCKDGWSINQIAKRLNRGYASIQREIHKGGGPQNYTAEASIKRAEEQRFLKGRRHSLQRSERHPLSPYTDEIKERRAKGETYASLGRFFGVSLSTMFGFCANRGIDVLEGSLSAMNSLRFTVNKVGTIEEKISNLEQHVEILSELVKDILNKKE